MMPHELALEFLNMKLAEEANFGVDTSWKVCYSG
jgi:hypothetical protein